MTKIKVYCQDCKYRQENWCYNKYYAKDSWLAPNDYNPPCMDVNRNNNCGLYEKKRWWQ